MVLRVSKTVTGLALSTYLRVSVAMPLNHCRMFNPDRSPSRALPPSHRNLRTVEPFATKSPSWKGSERNTVCESSFRNRVLKISIPDKIKTSLAISSASQSCPGYLMFWVVISPLWMSSSRALLMRDSISAVMSGLFGIVFFRLKWYINFN